MRVEGCYCTEEERYGKSLAVFITKNLGNSFFRGAKLICRREGDNGVAHPTPTLHVGLRMIEPSQFFVHAVHQSPSLSLLLSLFLTASFTFLGQLLRLERERDIYIYIYVGNV